MTRANTDAALLAIPMELQHIGAKIAAGLTETHNGLRLTGARFHDVSRRLVSTGSGRLVGWSVRATGGPVTVLLRNGRDSAGDVMALIDLVDTESDTQWFGPGGIAFPEALFLDQTGTGTLTGALWLGAVD